MKACRNFAKMETFQYFLLVSFPTNNVPSLCPKHSFPQALSRTPFHLHYLCYILGLQTCLHFQIFCLRGMQKRRSVKPNGSPVPFIQRKERRSSMSPCHCLSMSTDNSLTVFNYEESNIIHHHLRRVSFSISLL